MKRCLKMKLKLKRRINRQNKKKQGLTPNQMLSKLPISLVQLTVGNNIPKQ